MCRRVFHDVIHHTIALRTIALVEIVTMLACGHSGGGGTTTATSDSRTARRMQQAVGNARGPARLLIEFDPRRRPVGPATLHTFTLQLEEKITAVDRQGAQVTARLIDVVGVSGEPALTDQLALALDDLKISFRRNDRGAIRDLKIDGLRPPLEAHLARAIVVTLFGANRGPSLPEKAIGLQDDWTTDTDSELAGLTAHLHSFYTLLEKRDDELHFRAKGKLEAIGSVGTTRRKIEGETFSDETVDLQHGSVLRAEYEWSYAVEDDPPADGAGVGRTRIRAERGLAVPTKAP